MIWLNYNKNKRMQVLYPTQIQKRYGNEVVSQSWLKLGVQRENS
jgi:hypothetical protein